MYVIILTFYLYPISHFYIFIFLDIWKEKSRKINEWLVVCSDIYLVGSQLCQPPISVDSNTIIIRSLINYGVVVTPSAGRWSSFKAEMSGEESWTLLKVYKRNSALTMSSSWYAWNLYEVLIAFPQ
jgi:hypothetical protein